MTFSSSIFLFAFFPVFFGMYYLVPNRFKNITLVFFSLLSYAWGARGFVLIVMGTLAVDYILGKVMYEKPRYRKLCVTVDILMNVALLLYFKYANFFMDNINAAMETLGLHPFVFTRVLLPLGISFVVFQKMTYCLDIARGRAKPAKSYWHLLEFQLLFPNTLAGPIIKYSEIADQITSRAHNWDAFMYGFRRFSVGLFKKVWIADVLAKYADTVFNANGGIPIDYAWIGGVAYTLQIFFDFAGYSDMAIGMLSMMGFRVNENFTMPYIATSITDFWKRWHISLTSWFREYIYIPLGGNRKGKLRTYINQWIVFLVSGLWHGAAWNFVFWGAYHGTLLCAERAFLANILKKIPRILRLAMTFFLVMIGWIFFRASSIEAGFAYIATMFNPASYNLHINPSDILLIDARGWFVFALAAVICFVPFFFPNAYTRVRTWITAKPALMAGIVLCLFALAAMKVITGSVTPFIYFRF